MDLKKNKRLYTPGIRVFLILFLIQGVSLSAVTLYMKDIVPVNDQILLGQIVTIKGTSFSLKEKIRNYPLPLSGTEIHILPTRYIHNLISQFTHTPVIISGTTSILIPQSRFHSMGKEYTTKFINFLTTELYKKNNRVEIEVISQPDSSSLSLTQDLQFKLYYPRKYMDYVIGEIKVDMLSNDNPDHEHEYWIINVHQHIPVIKAKQALKKNEDLVRDNLIIEEQYLTPFKGEFLLPDDTIDGYKISRDIKKGDSIYRAYLRKSLKVRSGEKVSIILQRGSIILSMTGRAGDSGSIGDSVKVRPSLSSEWLIGKVTGSREVHIEL